MLLEIIQLIHLLYNDKKNHKEFYPKYYLEWCNSKKFQVYLERSINDNWGYFNIPDQILDLKY